MIGTAIRTAILAISLTTVIEYSSALANTPHEGMASFYKHGRFTASGETFKPNGLTAAHRTLPFGTMVKVTHTKTGRHVVVRINDRGPFSKGRIIDISHGAAKKLGIIRAGVAKVAIEVLP